MFMRYSLYLFILTTILSIIEDQAVNDCLEGEIWYEWCKECKCSEERNHICRKHSSNCLQSFFSAEHLGNVTVFSDDRRCHYSNQKQKTICVRMTYQKDMNGTRCMKDSYFYDNCTFCKCDLRALKYICHFTDGNLKTSGGVCNPEQGIIENFCYACFCTFTRFRFCTLSELCTNREEKPGNCPILPHFYSKSVQDFCLFERYQECYTDYGCLGFQKCCRVADCFLRCVNPV